MNNEQINLGIRFMIGFYENIEFHKDIAVATLDINNKHSNIINYMGLHDQVKNALFVSQYLAHKGFSIFWTIQQHLEKTLKETFVLSKNQQNGEKNNSPILVNINYDQLTKDRFSKSVKHRIESLKFIEKCFS